MEQKIYTIIGAVFLSLSGLLLTAERIAERLSIAIRDAGFASAGMSTPGIEMFPGFFDNFFVCFFFLIGVLLLANRFLRSVLNNYHQLKE